MCSRPVGAQEGSVTARTPRARGGTRRLDLWRYSVIDSEVDRGSSRRPGARRPV